MGWGGDDSLVDLGLEGRIAGVSMYTYIVYLGIRQVYESVKINMRLRT
jgi:hypothetical protein